MIQLQDNTRGFTVVETLVALTIFSSAIVFLIVVTAGGVADTNYAKNRLVASYLAQEGIELTRNIRDTNVLSNAGGSGWGDFLVEANVCRTAEGCNIDPVTLDVCHCTGSTCKVPYTKTNGYYGYQKIQNNGCAIGSASISPYTRVIRVETNDQTVGVDDVRVTSTVTWFQGLGEKSVYYETILMDWQPHLDPLGGGQ